MAKLTKEQKEDQFIEALEQVLGGHLLPWQREVVLYIRSTSMGGNEIDMSQIKEFVRNKDKLAQGLSSR